MILKEMDQSSQSDRTTAPRSPGVTNFSIENLLRKETHQKKPLNKVLANPWTPLSPPFLFKPKVLHGPQIFTNPMAVLPPYPYKPDPFVNCDIRALPSGSSGSFLPGYTHNNNNVLAVNNYSYYFENPLQVSSYLSALKPGVPKVEKKEEGEEEEVVLVEGESQKCTICDKVFGTLELLEQHERTHKSPRYECQECGKGFSQLRNFKYHISVHRGTKEFAAKCSECGKVFNDKGYLSSHMKIHRNKKEYECPHCPKSFNQRVAFNMHIRIHTGIKPHKCDECGKKFSRKMLLKQHARTHSGEKPYQCNVCGKQFADRSNMTLHHRLHSGIKPFACPICPKAFTKKHHLKTHLNYHTGYKPYKCPHPGCGQNFTQSSNMRTHAKKCQFKVS